MSELKRVLYSGCYKKHVFEIQCWQGTPLGHVWNDIKSMYLPGDRVTITDNFGNARTFVKGMT